MAGSRRTRAEYFRWLLSSRYLSQQKFMLVLGMFLVAPLFMIFSLSDGPDHPLVNLTPSVHSSKTLTIAVSSSSPSLPQHHFPSPLPSLPPRPSAPLPSVFSRVPPFPSLVHPSANLTIWTILRELPVLGEGADEFRRSESDRSIEDVIVEPRLYENGSASSSTILLSTYNAVRSWLRLPDVSILLFGRREDCRFIEEEVVAREKAGGRRVYEPDRLHCEPVEADCLSEEFGVPYYNCLFAKAAFLSRTDYLMYSNSDIVYFGDLLGAFEKVRKELGSSFVMTGTRYDLWYPKHVDFDMPGSYESFFAHAKRWSTYHGESGLDYFLYSKMDRAVGEMPPFLVGRIRWDNWLLSKYNIDDDLVSIDCSKVITAIHLNHMRIGLSHNRTGTDFNKELGKQESYDVKDTGVLSGMKMELAVFPAQRTCPLCDLRHRSQNLKVAALRNVKNSWLIVATVTEEYVAMALNWVCSLRRIGVTNYLLHTVDNATNVKLTSLGLNSVLVTVDDVWSEISDNGSIVSVIAKDVRHPRRWLDMVFLARGMFVLRLLRMEVVNVFVSDVDTVFLSDPFEAVSQDTYHNLMITMTRDRLEQMSLSFAFFRFGGTGHETLEAAVARNRRFLRLMNATKADSVRPLVGSQEWNLNVLLKRDYGPGKLWTPLLPSLFLHSKYALALTDKTHNFIFSASTDWPVAIHINHVQSVADKREWLMKSNRWHVVDSTEAPTCQTFPVHDRIPRLGAEILYRPEYVFKLTSRCNSSAGFAALIDSLNVWQETTMATDDHDRELHRLRRRPVHVDVEIHLRFPDESDLEGNKCMHIAEKMDWKLGEKSVIGHESANGWAGLWLDSWERLLEGGKYQNKLIVALQDDVTVSADFRLDLVTNLVSNLNRYGERQYDPRILGISLLPDDGARDGALAVGILGLSHLNTSFYRCQRLSTSAFVAFPNHWTEFAIWYASRRAISKVLPVTFSDEGGTCVSCAIEQQKNETEDRSDIRWKSWLNFFMAERGWYSLWMSDGEKKAPGDSAAVDASMRRSPLLLWPFANRSQTGDGDRQRVGRRRLSSTKYNPDRSRKETESRTDVGGAGAGQTLCARPRSLEPLALKPLALKPLAKGVQRTRMILEEAEGEQSTELSRAAGDIGEGFSSQQKIYRSASGDDLELRVGENRPSGSGARGFGGFSVDSDGRSNAAAVDRESCDDPPYSSKRLREERGRRRKMTEMERTKNVDGDDDGHARPDPRVGDREGSDDKPSEGTVVKIVDKIVVKGTSRRQRYRRRRGTKHVEQQRLQRTFRVVPGVMETPLLDFRLKPINGEPSVLEGRDVLGEYVHLYDQ